jgi:tetratricopeptide (TPR) repeat protein
LAIYPKNIHLRRLLAETYLEINQTSNAEAELTKAVELISDLADVHRLQAELFEKQGRNEEALEALKIYLAYRPQDKGALRLRDDLEPKEESPLRETLSSSEEIVSTVEEDMGEESSEIVTSTLAELYFDQGKIKEAINTYKNLIEQNPEDTHFRSRLQELEAIAENEASDDQEVDAHAGKKQRMIAILESWRATIREHVNPSAVSQK